MREWQVSVLGPDRWLVQTSCHECLIDVEASKDVPDARWITVNLLSTHNGRWEGRLRSRLRYAWQVLRGQGWPALEFNTLEETDGLLWTLYEARARAFDAPVPAVFSSNASANTATVLLPEIKPE